METITAVERKEREKEVPSSEMAARLVRKTDF